MLSATVVTNCVAHVSGSLGHCLKDQGPSVSYHQSLVVCCTMNVCDSCVDWNASA